MNDVAGKDQGSSMNAIEPSSYRVSIIARCEVAQRTMALYFERPDSFSLPRSPDTVSDRIKFQIGSLQWA
jgi:hypothetical protein